LISFVDFPMGGIVVAGSEPRKGSGNPGFPQRKMLKTVGF